MTALFLMQGVAQADPILDPPPIFDGNVPEVTYQIGNGSLFYDINDPLGTRNLQVSGILRITASDTMTDAFCANLDLSNGEKLRLNGMVDSTFPPLNPTFSSLFAEVPSKGKGVYHVSWRPFIGEFETIHYSFVDRSDFFVFSDADFEDGRRYGIILNGSFVAPEENIPEPATLIMLALGCVAALHVKRS